MAESESFDSVISAAREENCLRLKTNFESIIEKYSYEFPESDSIDLSDFSVVQDQGHLERIGNRYIGHVKLAAHPPKRRDISALLNDLPEVEEGLEDTYILDSTNSDSGDEQTVSSGEDELDVDDGVSREAETSDDSTIESGSESEAESEGSISDCELLSDSDDNFTMIAHTGKTDHQHTGKYHSIPQSANTLQNIKEKYYPLKVTEHKSEIQTTSEVKKKVKLISVSVPYWDKNNVATEDQFGEPGGQGKHLSYKGLQIKHHTDLSSRSHVQDELYCKPSENTHSKDNNYKIEEISFVKRSSDKSVVKEVNSSSLPSNDIGKVRLNSDIAARDTSEKRIDPISMYNMFLENSPSTPKRKRLDMNGLDRSPVTPGKLLSPSQLLRKMKLFSPRSSNSNSPVSVSAKRQSTLRRSPQKPQFVDGKDNNNLVLSFDNAGKKNLEKSPVGFSMPLAMQNQSPENQFQKLNKSIDFKKPRSKIEESYSSYDKPERCSKYSARRKLIDAPPASAVCSTPTKRYHKSLDISSISIIEPISMLESHGENTKHLHEIVESRHQVKPMGIVSGHRRKDCKEFDNKKINDMQSPPRHKQRQEMAFLRNDNHVPIYKRDKKKISPKTSDPYHFPSDSETSSMRRNTSTSCLGHGQCAKAFCFNCTKEFE